MLSSLVTLHWQGVGVKSMFSPFLQHFSLHRLDVGSQSRIPWG